MTLDSQDTGGCLFSIVTVCRNADRSIARTVESVLAQTEFGGTLEHIVIDGLSTDRTLEVLGGYPHLRVVSEPDTGIYDAMNKGIAHARGEFVGILNGDDWYEADALAAVAGGFRDSPSCAIVHGDIRRWSEHGPIDVVKPPHRGGFWGQVLMPVHHPATFVRREVFARFGAFNTSFRLFADFEWISRVIRLGVALHYCPRVLTNFSVGGASTVRFAARERYRVFRAGGVKRLPAAAAVAYSCGAVLRTRLETMRSKAS